jgi:hypothetical protein
MLLIIAMYGTIQMLTKSVLAIYYHFAWLFSDCRCFRKMLYPDRAQRVDKLWARLNKEYREATRGINF